MTKQLSVVPPVPGRGALEDLSRDEAVDWLRKMMNVAMELCDAIDAHLGPEHPPQRPQLRVIPGGSDNQDQDQDVTRS
jgi:hypothetical protein